MKTYYLYFDNFSFSDSFSSNAILCERIMPNKKGTKTFSRSTENFLFLTHKKINNTLRAQGITDSLSNWAVTLELFFDSAKYSQFPVFFVRKEGDNIFIEKGDLKDYNEDIHLGAYVYMEIPFTMVSHIYFENEEQLMDSDKSIFPDFLWRSDIVRVVNNDDFIDNLDLLSANEDVEEQILNKMADVDYIYMLNKYKAAILQYVNGSRQWISDKHLTTFDKSLLDFFGINVDDVKNILETNNCSYNPLILTEKSEALEIIPSNKETISEEQKIYNAIARVFIFNNEKCTPAIVNQLLYRIKENISLLVQEQALNEVNTTIDAIEGCYLNNVGFSLDDTLERISTIHGKDSVFKALFFAIKNPSDYEKFVLSLSVYKVDKLTARRSMVLWGVLNGLRGIPANGANRDNLILWENIESKSLKFVNNEMHYKFNDESTNTDKTCGIIIDSKEIITLDEVYAFFADKKSCLTVGFLKDVYTVAKSCDKKISKNDPYIKYTLSKMELLSLFKVLEKEADKLLSKAELCLIDKTFSKNYKDVMTKCNKNAVCDYEAIYKDWILNRDNFVKIWNLIEDKIKLFYVSQRGKNE